MNLQSQYLNPNPSCSKSRSVWRDGTLKMILAHDVFLVDHCYTTTSGCCFRMLLSKDQLLVKWPFSNHTATFVYLSRKSYHDCHVHGKLNSLNWYCCLWRRIEISLSLTESTGWSWLLCTDSTRHQSSKLGQWSPVFRAEQLIRNLTELQCVLITNCLPQTVQAAICRLVPDTE